MIKGSGERLKSAFDSGSNEIEITNGKMAKGTHSQTASCKWTLHPSLKLSSVLVAIQKNKAVFINQCLKLHPSEPHQLRSPSPKFIPSNPFR
jgi:hypothetical protein